VVTSSARSRMVGWRRNGGDHGAPMGGHGYSGHGVAREGSEVSTSEKGDEGSLASASRGRSGARIRIACGSDQGIRHQWGRALCMTSTS
jgi:hypothetical protein